MVSSKLGAFLVAVSFGNSVVFAAPAEESELTDRISKIVREYYPDAKVSQDNGIFRATHGTMMFTIHPRNKTGEIQERTYPMEGPNFQGFIIALSVMDGTYDGAAVVPQTLREPYWQTYIDRPATTDGKAHYVINFSYGVLNSEFKKAIFEALPKSTRETQRS